MRSALPYPADGLEHRCHRGSTTEPRRDAPPRLRRRFHTVRESIAQKCDEYTPARLDFDGTSIGLENEVTTVRGRPPVVEVAHGGENPFDAGGGAVQVARITATGGVFGEMCLDRAQPELQLAVARLAQGFEPREEFNLRIAPRRVDPRDPVPANFGPDHSRGAGTHSGVTQQPCRCTACKIRSKGSDERYLQKRRDDGVPVGRSTVDDAIEHDATHASGAAPSFLLGGLARGIPVATPGPFFDNFLAALLLDLAAR